MTSSAASVRTAMPDHDAPSVEPTADPWHAFGYITSGVMFYGVLGWAADLWLGTSGLVAVGIVGGAGLGIYMTWARFNKVETQGQDKHDQDEHGKNDTGDLR